MSRQPKPTAPVLNGGACKNSHLVRVRKWQQHFKTGVLDVTLVVNPRGAHFDRIVQAFDIVNAAQSYYRLRLYLDETGRFAALTDKTRSDGPIRAALRAAFPDQLTIVMVEHELSDGFTISEEPGCTIISCDDWDGDDNAPAMRVYLVYQLTSALITFAACLTVAENDAMIHEEDDDVSRGCLFDFWTNSAAVFMCMVGARLCDRCRSQLLAHGTAPAAIAATERLLDWIRAVILGRERPLPQSVFIGHGRNDDWKVIRDLLEKWGLPVEEFNEAPVAGISISQRLKAMLEQSRFAFLVMTGEDKNDEGRLQARMNVIHEIGLFQGRLGTEYAAVLRRRDADIFSNLDGINRLDYDKGRIGDLRDEIHRLLIARGIMSADTGMAHSD